MGDAGAAALGGALQSRAARRGGSTSLATSSATAAASPCAGPSAPRAVGAAGGGAGGGEAGGGLEVVRLGSNKLGEASGVAFGRALGRAPSLRALHLPQNSLGAKAGEALVGGAEASGAVMAVAVEGNLIPYATLIRLEERLGANRKRARDERPMRLTAKVRELERTAEALRAARAELAAPAGARGAERRQRVLGASLESERQALLAAKADGGRSGGSTRTRWRRRRAAPRGSARSSRRSASSGTRRSRRCGGARRRRRRACAR